MFDTLKAITKHKTRAAASRSYDNDDILGTRTTPNSRRPERAYTQISHVSVVADHTLADGVRVLRAHGLPPVLMQDPGLQELAAQRRTDRILIREMVTMSIPGIS